MKNFLITFLAVILAQLVLIFVFVVGSTVVVSVLMMRASGGEVQVPARAYLTQEIPISFLEYEPPRHLPVLKRAVTHTMILENLEKARHDERIAGVVLRIQPTQEGWGKLAEIRERVRQLRAAGKPVWAHLELGTNKSLYLASACDSIFLPPQSLVWLTGLMSERYYLRELLDRLGMDFQVSQIREYKAAAEMVTRGDMSPAARANAEWVLGDLYEDLLRTLAEDRGVDRARVAQWLERAQFDPAEALAEGIIDGVRVWEDEVAGLRAMTPGAELIAAREYERITRTRLGLRGARLAVVHGQGTITAGKSDWIYPFGNSMGDETMVAALEDAAANDRIQGVLLRLDTPGGMGLASERIGQAVARLAAKKPVVVSSVDINASGGYMISYRCSTLVALPNSIVGSIGSFSMRPSFQRLMEKIGVQWDRVTVGPHATLFSPVRALTAEEFARFEAVHWKGYEEWVAGVARHRGMTVAQVDSLARGRVFTGRQAHENGLIDELGGFDVALALLKRQAGIAADADVTLLHYPERKEIWEELAAGEWGAALRGALVGVGLRSATEERLASTIEFWQRWMETDEPLAICEWRF